MPEAPSPAQVFVVHRVPNDTRSATPAPERAFLSEADARAYVRARQPDYAGSRFHITPLEIEAAPVAFARVHTLTQVLAATGLSPVERRTSTCELTEEACFESASAPRRTSHRDGRVTLRVVGTDLARCERGLADAVAALTPR